MRRLFALSLLAALCGLNRMDALLLVLPALLYAFWQVRSVRAAGMLVLGFVPFGLWELFSLVYYGFPFPNTAYAKLNTGLSQAESLWQGWLYFVDSLGRDPITLLTIVCGILLALAVRNGRSLTIAAGIGCYLYYILDIGGDFMSGRFFTAPLVLAVIVVVHWFYLFESYWLLVLAVMGILGFSSAWFPAKTDATYQVGAISITGIADERGFYYPSTGILNVTRMAEGDWSFYRAFDRSASVFARPNEVIAIDGGCGRVGSIGMAAGPQVHVVDQCALGDPLLARLPAMRNPDWRIGHFWRAMPEGYLETLRTGKNQFRDHNLGQYYEKLALITRGHMFDPQRWVAIWGVNTGGYDGWIDQDRYRNPGLVHLSLAEVSGMTEARRVSPGGIQVYLESPQHAPVLEMSLNADQDYEIVYRLGAAEVAQQRVKATRVFAPDKMTVHVLDIPKEAVQTGYDTIRVLPVVLAEGQLGGLRLLEDGGLARTRMLLGRGWQTSDEATPFFTFPEELLVASPYPQQSILQLIPKFRNKPPEAGMKVRKGSCVLDVYRGLEVVQSIELSEDRSSATVLELEAGYQTLGLRVRDGSVQLDDGEPVVGSVRLQTADSLAWTDDILVNNQPQERTESTLKALYGTGWYQPSGNERWASSPADLFIYSPKQQIAALHVTPISFYPSAGEDEGTMHVAVAGEQGQTQRVKAQQLFTVTLDLRKGWNRVTLALKEGDFVPGEVRVGQDGRILSFAVREMNIMPVTRP